MRSRDRSRAFLTYSLLLALALILCSCGAQLHQYDLSQDISTSLHFKGSEDGKSEPEVDNRKGVLAATYYRGDLLGGAIWWARKGIEIDKEDDFLVIADNVGPDSTRFGSTFPPLDFKTEQVHVKISARAESNDGKDPILVMHLIDGNGYRTNAKSPSVVIANSEEYEEYTFLLEGAFFQSLPDQQQVNAGFINSIEMFINPGGDAFTGKIYIEELRVTKVPAQ